MKIRHCKYFVIEALEDSDKFCSGSMILMCALEERTVSVGRWTSAVQVDDFTCPKQRADGV